MPLTNSDQFETGLDYFMSKVGPDITPMMIRVFLHVARTGTCTHASLRDKLGLTVSSSSRNVAYWTDKRFDGREGPDFIERMDGKDGRYEGIKLTAAGRRFYQGYLKALQKQKDGATA